MSIASEFIITMNWTSGLMGAINSLSLVTNVGFVSCDVQ